MKKLISVILALVLILSCLPLTAAAKETSIEAKFRLLLEDMELDPAIHSADRYFYQELISYPNVKDTEWVLIRAGLSNIYGLEVEEHWGTLGSKYIASDRRCAPFSFGFGVYDVRNNTFYDLVDAWEMNFDGLHEMWNQYAGKLERRNYGEVGYAVTIGDADDDGSLSILDATRIQRILALMDEDRNDLSFSKDSCVRGCAIGSICDFDRDGRVTVLDATKIQRSLAAMPNVLDYKLAWDERLFDEPGETFADKALITDRDQLDESKRDQKEILDAYDDAYFADHSLIALHIELSSGSDRLTLSGVSIDKDGVLNVDFSRSSPGVNQSGTTDMNHRFVVIEVSNAFIDDIRDVNVNITVEPLPETEEAIVAGLPQWNRIAEMPDDPAAEGYRSIETTEITMTSPHRDYFDWGELTNPGLIGYEGYVLLIPSREELQRYLPGFDAKNVYDEAYFKENAILVMLGQGTEEHDTAEIGEVAVKGEALYVNAYIASHVQYVDGEPVMEPTAPFVWTFREVKKSDVKDVKQITCWTVPYPSIGSQISFSVMENYRTYGKFSEDNDAYLLKEKEEVAPALGMLYVDDHGSPVERDGHVFRVERWKDADFYRHVIALRVFQGSADTQVSVDKVRRSGKDELTVEVTRTIPSNPEPDMNWRFIFLTIPDYGKDFTVRVNVTRVEQDAFVADAVDYYGDNADYLALKENARAIESERAFRGQFNLTGSTNDAFDEICGEDAESIGYLTVIRTEEQFNYVFDGANIAERDRYNDVYFENKALVALVYYLDGYNLSASLTNLGIIGDQLYAEMIVSEPWDLIEPLYDLYYDVHEVSKSSVKNIESLALWKNPARAFFEEIITDDKKVESCSNEPLAHNSLSTSTRVFTWDYQKYGDGSDFLNQPYRVAILRSYAEYEAFFSADHLEGVDEYDYYPIYQTVDGKNYMLDEAFFEDNALIVGVGYFCTGDEYLSFDEIRQSDDGEVLTVRFNRYTYGDLHPYEPYAANILGYCFAAAAAPKDAVKYVSAVQMLPQVKKLPDDAYVDIDYIDLINQQVDFYTNFSEYNEAIYVTTPQELTTAIDTLMVDELGEHIIRGGYRFTVEDTASYGDAWFATHDMIAARVYRGGSNTVLYVTGLQRSAAGNLRLQCTKLHDEYDTPDNAWNFIFLSIEKQEGKPIVNVEVFDEGYLPMPEKPIIYLYPEEETELTVTLGKPEELTCTYPAYNSGWHITAKPDGTLIGENGRSYYALYWESKSKTPVSMPDGFVVRGEDTASFLEEKLAILGLSEREAQEFIVYWLPQMQNNAYNLIRFATAEEIEEIMPLSFSVQPDTVIRVLMEYTPLDEAIEIPEQKLTAAPERKGFVAVEWGGARIG